MSLEKLKKKIFNHKTFLVVLLILGILAILSFIFGLITFNNEILFLTFLALLWYAWETKKIREIEQEPVMMLYVINPISNTIENLLKREYAIIDGNFDCLSLRNVGRGPAFNVEVKDRDDIFLVKKYQCKFFAPEMKSGEQAIKIIRKDEKKIKSYDEIKEVVFEVSCKNINGRLYKFQYEIIDIEKEEVKYLG